MSKEGWFIVIKLDMAGQPGNPLTQDLDRDRF